MTERLDRIERGLEDLNSTINVLITEFIRPNAQQAQSNFKAIGQIDGDLDRLNESIARSEASHAASMESINAVLAATAVQQAQNTEGIDTLLGAMSTTEIEMQRVFGEIAESNQRFEILRNEAIADRAKADADRERWQAAFEADRAEWQAALEADRARADADRAEWKAGFDAQQEIIQRMLLEIRSSNGAINQLSDRIDDLGQAS